MQLYDFHFYVQKRKERNAAQAVVEVASDINRPGSVIELKRKISVWFELHKEVAKRIA